ncbi:hypothetical protein K443DRAFT_325376 [Laccaria amethystina LaAM-08-1]|uniref:Uncharacterized protein n=1 Tax=Laccaria amethystina LaAM-08-1 TaxID=1095629 RepID=A0A0C9WJY3_9AGAR|nr:hypothetical protein K443DRAFT_325376 [Laccaria amethystina LaAM-08-1]
MLTARASVPDNEWLGIRVNRYVGGGTSASFRAKARTCKARLKTHPRLISVSNSGIHVFSNDVSHCARPHLDCESNC